MTSAATPKACFVIGAIGAADSDARVHADWLLDHVIKPVLENDPFKYVVTRADQVSEPGMISGQVIMAAINSDLVIADLTGFNPNAFYELGIRHMMGKPVIHMMEDDGITRIPFDVSDYRAIMFKTRTVARTTTAHAFNWRSR